VRALTSGFQKLGLRLIRGLNSGSLIGYSPITLTIDPQTATRDSAETSFLRSTLGRANVRLYPSTLAKKIIFDEKKRARGVLLDGIGDKNHEYVISAKIEVIVTAGVVSRILMLDCLCLQESSKPHSY
jgi:choline dehydrogenase